MAKSLNDAKAGVWCTRCVTNLLGDRKIILRHFRLDHNAAPSEAEVRRILTNVMKPKSLKGKKKRKVLPLPTRYTPDPDVEKERAWKAHMVSGGAWGLGKRR